MRSVLTSSMFMRMMLGLSSLMSAASARDAAAAAERSRKDPNDASPFDILR